jgi:hypothetical protein
MVMNIVTITYYLLAVTSEQSSPKRLCTICPAPGNHKAIASPKIRARSMAIGHKEERRLDFEGHESV